MPEQRYSVNDRGKDVMIESQQKGTCTVLESNPGRHILYLLTALIYILSHQQLK
jgi:hypothetical protein